MTIFKMKFNQILKKMVHIYREKKFILIKVISKLTHWNMD